MRNLGRSSDSPPDSVMMAEDRLTISGRSILVLAAVLVVLVATAGSIVGTAAATDTQQDTLEVVVNDDGTAHMTMTLIYNLSDDDDAAAFDSLVEDEEAQAEVLDRFESRMASVADDTSDALDRDVTVRDAAINLEHDEEAEVGIVELSITWENLVTVEDDMLTLTEPFSSGFDFEGEFHIVMPDGYEVADVTPASTTTDDQRLVFTEDEDLNGFELVMEATEDVDITPTEDSNDSTDDDSIPGFGIVTALAGLMVIGYLFATQRRNLD